MTTRTSRVTLIALAALATGAAADTVYLATSGSTLYRASRGGSVETFSLADDITCLINAPGGEVFAISSTETGSGAYEAYRLVDYLTNSPSLVLVRDDLVNSYPAGTFVGGTFYAYRNGSRNLVTYDFGTGVETEIGPSAPMQAPVGGATYDPATDTFYAVSRTDAALFTIDYAAGSGSPDATEVGPLGVSIFNMGIEFYAGSLFGAFQDTTNGRFVAGVIDPGTGGFSADTVLFAGTLDGSVGFAVVPSPASLALLGAGGLVLSRRRGR